MIWRGPLAHQQAVGARGIYRIRHVARGLHILTGIGHDEFPMLGVPVLGRGLGSLAEARAFAEGLDRVPAEAWVSGA